MTPCRAVLRKFEVDTELMTAGIGHDSGAVAQRVFDGIVGDHVDAIF